MAEISDERIDEILYAPTEAWMLVEDVQVLASSVKQYREFMERERLRLEKAFQSLIGRRIKYGDNGTR
jgi:hypothetical protein